MSKNLDEWTQKVTELFGEISNMPEDDQKKAKSIIRSLSSDRKDTQPILDKDEIDFISETLGNNSLD
ncbi:MAG: hypothetical protein ACRBB3_08235 [Alphaproteobacteria bacterium]